MAQIIASHIVKPSSPTSNTLRKHNLSTLDQISPPVYITLIFFYQNVHLHQDHEESSRRLKQSLSEILTIFYPLAGRMHQNSFVDCDDLGVEMVEARVHDVCPSQLAENPKMEELEQLLPPDFSSHTDNPIMSVRTSYFDCGGIAVGVCFPHKMGDISSFAMFMNAWAATCRGEASRIILPSFDLALRFPPRESLASGFYPGITGGKIVTRRLVFEREEVEKMRKEACTSEVKDPSRVEAVSSFLWRSFIEAHRKVDEETTSFPTLHMVNMRRRAVPPVPDHAFGNLITFAPAMTSKEEEEDEDGVLVSRLRAAIRGVDEEYIKAISDDEFVTEVLGQIEEFFEPGNCLFTSWVRFPLYDVDFGWGKPVRVCTATIPYMNLVILMDTPPSSSSGDGIEAWVNVPDDDFFELLQASCNKNLH